MAAPPTVFIVCSDRDGNGKTLLARVLTDYLLMEERDPFCFDLAAPTGGLRKFFPGRTAVVDFTQDAGRDKVFTTLIDRPGRDYVIDVPAVQLAELCEAARKAGLSEAAHSKGFRVAVLYIVDRDDASLQTAVSLEQILDPDLFVPVANRFIGSALPEGVPGPVLVMEKLHAELQSVIAHKHFSLREFMISDDESLPARMRSNLKTFLQRLVAGMAYFEPALRVDAARNVAFKKGV